MFIENLHQVVGQVPPGQVQVEDCLRRAESETNLI